MNSEITTLALFMGLVFGSIMLSAVCWVYVKHQHFGTGGSVLTIFGVVLLGLSVWKTVELSISPEGIDARFSKIEEKIGAVERNVKQVESTNQEVRQKVNEVTQLVEHLEMRVIRQAPVRPNR